MLAGATGVVGRRVIPMLVAARHEVTAVSRSAENHAALVRTGATPLTLDLFDAGAVRRAVPGHDVLVNLTTHIPPSRRAFLPGAWRENNRVRATVSANLAAAALACRAERLVQESFAPIYESAGDRWIDERMPVRVARYNSGVVDAENAVERFTQAGRVGVVLRFAYFYGPDSDFTLDAIRLVRRGWAPAFGSPQAFISSVSHDDAAAAVVAALDLPAGIYNVSDNRPVQRREFVDSLAKVLDVRPPRFFPRWMTMLVGSLGDTLGRSQRVSNTKLRGASAWAPRYPSVVEGWRATVLALAAGVGRGA